VAAVHAVGVDLRNRGSNRLGAWRCRACLLAVAQNPDALHLFGKVHEEKVGVERLDDCLNIGDGHLRRQCAERCVGAIRFAVAQFFPQRPQLFDQSKCLFACLVANDFAEQVSQKTDRC
jgi:hypothetical protein